MAGYDVGPQRESLLADTATLGLLPPELLSVIQGPSTTTSSTTTTPATRTLSPSTPSLPPSASFLDAVAQAALLPRLTGPLFAHFQPLFADICARWLLHARRGAQDDAVVAAFARVLPLAPYLTVLFDKYLLATAPVGTMALSRLQTLSDRNIDTPSSAASSAASSPSFSSPQSTETAIVRILLALWRLVSLDVTAYMHLVPTYLQTFFFRHPSHTIRYLAIRIFCLVHAAADYKLETLLRQFVGQDESLLSDFDGVEVDYTFLTLYEHTRCKAWHDRAAEIQSKMDDAKMAKQGSSAVTLAHPQPDMEATKTQQPAPPASSSPPFVLPLTPLVCAWGRSVVPRPAAISTGDSLAAASQPPLLVRTATTLANLEALAQCLQRPEPVLVRGLPGSGKTSLIRDAARELGTEAGLVTLHLNEQTDAKTLIGLYSTGAKPGSFEWRAGILTAAVHEGRWVLIEDLDRAPTEVMSTILPLIERRELLIPSRRETIKAARNFRIFATVRTSLGLSGQETTRSLLGERLWQQLSVRPLPPSELRQVIHDTFPSLRPLIADILSVFDQLTSLSLKKNTFSLVAIERPMTLRDLFKWCRRLAHVFSRQQHSISRTEQTLASTEHHAATLSETALIGIFLDAVDCFAGSVKDERARRFLGQHIAQALRIPPEVAEHALSSHEPQFHDSEKQLVVGRAVLRKPRRAVNRLAGRTKSRPFATTAHARRLLEQIAVAVDLKEPLLLVGETGIGKTTVVQQLAASMGHKLVVVNLSQQSEVGDLLGGFKPVNARSLAMPLKEEFEDLFAATGISTEKNEKYLKRVSTSSARGKWTDVCRLWQQAPKIFAKIVEQLSDRQSSRAAVDAEETAAAAAAAAAANGGKYAEATTAPDQDGRQPAKRRKTESSKLQALLDLKPRWDAFSEKLEQFGIQIASGSGAFAFAFVEGKIVQAVRNGDWLLLDEINLASPDTLESIADLLSSGPGDTPSILLSETGEIDKIEAHPEFRVFGAMNPATDVGKRDLPIGLRSRFTELYVASPDKEVQDLVPIIKTYLKGHAKATDRVVERVARLYLAIKNLAEKEKRLVDGANEVPHYSLRTLTRVLSYVDDVAPLYGLERALFEGFCMGFLTLLSQSSENLVMPIIFDHLFGGSTSKQRRNQILSQPPKIPGDGRQYIRFFNKDKDRHYWLLQGAEPPRERSDYIRTAYVERNLLNLVRATSTRRFPILIQGPTSAGKTSMIEYLAHFSGNKFVRINNHEHTDLQEYLGTYVSGSDGTLHFQEGVLVQAMRQGYWIVLDELNLAPTDVLEALNRLLDDNRELLIPETQEIVRPHESFMLFATQNPPGLYGGRKMLSRAFRNRFLELHFDDIPEEELGYILQMRCRNTAPSDCERIVAVYKELSRLRQTSRVFEQKNSFATLRDLFRWALRDADNRDQIACHGFMLLAERVRDDEERMAVKSVIETIFKTKIDLEALYYGPDASPELRRFVAQQTAAAEPVVWTKAMRRLFVLVSQALKNNEPVLLVGETGCGKTTVCQLVAEAAGRALHIVNAHQNTETGDLIGSQRPVRNRVAILDSLRRALVEACTLLSSNPAIGADGGQETNGTGEDEDEDEDDTLDALLARYKRYSQEETARLPQELSQRIARDAARSKALFEWSDGSLVHALKTGSFFLLDEISLADDSVLERLNSVLEPQRTLLLAEKGVGDNDPSIHIQAEDGFQFLATMNPGGDFGKKELSPALRNRFTEIWVPPLTDSDDVLAIVSATLSAGVRHLAKAIVGFSYWFGRTFRASSATPFSIRDILVWAQFVNKCSQTSAPEFALIHGAATVFIDTLGANPSAMVSADPTVASEQRESCLRKLGELLGLKGAEVSSLYRSEPALRTTDNELWAGDFCIERSAAGALSDDGSFEFEAPTTRMNVMRVVRALQMNHKPVLLEGNPGVGKTTLISALARACGRPLTRINLSDQTDLMDLFGTDVPVEGADAGNFAWRDAPFLQAMQKGEWVLLDEMNLASQTVLEGLNACLDHRGEVYIAELDQTFKRHPDFCLFAAQNPHHQGGGRKGLPSSFVNRFIVVYADVFTEADQLRIAHKRYPSIPADTVRHITNFVAALEHEVTAKRAFGLQGAPWEFNLRDTLRWLELAAAAASSSSAWSTVQDFFDMTIRQRFRTVRDRQEVTRLFASVFGSPHEPHSLYHAVGAGTARVGFALLRRNLVQQPTPEFPGLVAAPRLAEIESLLVCVQNNLPCILVGPSGSGKSALLQHVAALAGKPLVVFPLSADVDAMDLVGGFEQADPVREVYTGLVDLKESLELFLLDRATASSDDTKHGMAAAAQVAAEALQLINLRPQNVHSHGGTNGEVDYFGRIADCLGRLAPLVDSHSRLAAVLSNTYNLLQKPLTLDNPRFEWLDSIIVHAVRAGHWLVLDNANLCNASVLDRLNSLLERPHGFLSINEHSGPDGEPRVVELHPDFRVFLTVDARYGELSRAMRNRSVEIYLDYDDDDSERSRVLRVDPYKSRIAPVEASMRRYLDVVNHAAAAPGDETVSWSPPVSEDAAALWLDNLSLGDSTLLRRFLQVTVADSFGQIAGHHALSRDALLLRLRALLAFVESSEAQPVRGAVLHNYNQYAKYRLADASDHEQSLLVHEQPLHPIQNASFVRAMSSVTGAHHDGVLFGIFPAFWWLGVCYERYANVFVAREHLHAHTQRASMYVSKPSQLNRLQRSSLAGQVALVARDSTSHAFRFLSDVAQLLLQLCLQPNLYAAWPGIAPSEEQAERYLLNLVWHFWWRTHALTAETIFDEAKFQAHLGHGRRLLDDARLMLEAGEMRNADRTRTHVTPFATFATSVAKHLEDDFAAGFQLTTGLSIDVLWPLLRPMPIPNAASFQQITSMERLAARFDNLKWHVPDAPVAVLGKIMTSLAEAYRLLRSDSRVNSTSLVQALEDEIAKLEAHVSEDNTPSAAAPLPLFADIFEAIRQLHVLYGYGSSATSDDDHVGTLVLSNLSTFAQLRLQSSVGVANKLQVVDYLLSQDSSIRPWSGTLSSQLLRTCDAVSSSTPLAALRSLESELPFVSKIVARSSASVVSDPVATLNNVLWDLLVAVVASHEASMQATVEALFDQALHHPQIASVEVAETGLAVFDTRVDGGSSGLIPALHVIWPGLSENLASSWPQHLGHHLAKIWSEHLLPAVLALAACKHHNDSSHLYQPLASIAWVQFAVGCIKLYTPDKVFDPFLKWQTEQEFYATLRASLQHKASILRQFDRVFTDQEATSVTNFRLKLVDEDVEVVVAREKAVAEKSSEAQTPVDVYRPPSTDGATTELSRLQKDVFNPVLDVTIKDNLSAAHYRLVSMLLSANESSVDAHQELQLVQDNIGRLIERLLSSFTAYQDLAVPLSNLLRCLQLGISLGRGCSPPAFSGKSEDTSGSSAESWFSVTPFLGGRFTQLEDVPVSLTRSWEFLLYGGVCANIERGAHGNDSRNNSSAVVPFSPDGRRRMFACFHFFYEQWKKKLEADSKAEEEKTNLYRFRGSQEDEEEMDAAEFSELFPTYYEDDKNGDKDSEFRQKKQQLPPSTTGNKSTWDLSADVAKIHRDILWPSRLATDVVLDFCKTTARNLAKEKKDTDAPSCLLPTSTINSTLFPATMLVLDDKLHDLQTAMAVPTTTAAATKAKAKAPIRYNFYSDANLPEARKLVALVHNIRTEFRDLQRVDEIGHLQPLADVVLATEKVLELGFAEPLAKIIPKVEKLHEFVYEWQFRGYASRQYARPALYDRLTATLVSWRKLELSTWSRLFDTEADKCREDAGAWWFIAYQAAVAGPLTILQESRLDDKHAGGSSSDSNILAYHAQQLLKELSSYLAGSIVGQYAARLDLLRQIQDHLGLLVSEYPALTVIHNAVQSLISFYARYETKAFEAVKKGRDSLHKTMNDVLLLASWRDTNIDALRESARRSHQKLFRLVRKFRAVLGQSMGPIILQGLPDDDEESQILGSGDVSLRLTDSTVDVVQPQAAAKLCEQLVPGWGTDAHTRRLSSVDRIVGIMAKASALPSTALDVPDVVASFTTDLLSSIVALRKETPGLLTEDNKNTVKHLKTRKIRLFDDTVKTVRQMGFSSNLGTSRLAAQRSLEIVFTGYTATRLPDEFDLAGLEYNFHKFLDFAPQFRDALHEHNGDLQRVTARRSVGYLEGMLFVVLNQRELLSRSARGLASLDGQIAYVEGLSADFAKQPAAEAKPAIQLEDHPSDHNRMLRWLVAVLRAAVHLVEVHGRLGAVDCQAVQMQLRTWTEKLEQLRLSLETKTPVLPHGFVSHQVLQLRNQIDEELQLFITSLNQQIEDRPDLAYILQQVKLWASGSCRLTDDKNGHAVESQAEKSLTNFTDEVLDLSKKVLDAVQKLNKTVSDLPTSIEEAAWLVNYNAKISAAVKLLHADTVIKSIEQCINLFRSVYGDAADKTQLSVPAALFRVLLPLLQQYATTYRHTLLHLAALHRSVCQLGHRLSRAFVEIAAQGFCTPPDKSAGEDQSNQENGKLEGGTGLGEGEGAEDISKDIQPDEDLSELAQTADKEKKEKDDEDGIEDEKDAIDMGNDEMEGELGSVAGDEDKEDEDKDGDDNKDNGEDEENDMDEEAGDVDDLDPTAVDEKMWDGEDDAKDTEKEQQGNESKGQKSEEDDQAAAADEDAKKNQAAEDKQAAAGDEGKPEEEATGDDEKEEGAEGTEEDDAVGSDDEQAGPQQELNRQDQNVDQNDVLDLPEDMELDGNEEGKDDEDDDDLDDLDDLEGEEENGSIAENAEDEKQYKEEMKDNDDDIGEEGDDNLDVPDVIEDDEGRDDKDEQDVEEANGEGEREEAEDEMEVDEEEELEEEAAPPPINNPKSNEKPAPSDVQSGVGQEQDNTNAGAEEQEQDDSAAKNKDNSAKRDQGDMGQQDADDKDMAAGADGVVSNRDRDHNDEEQAHDDPQNSSAEQDTQRQPFKKLGDVLERWHRTRQEIKQAEEALAEQETENKDSEHQAAQKEFQHLHDDNAAPSTQAMGAADDEEAQPFDDSMAIEEDEQQQTKAEEEEDGSGDGKHPGNDETNEDDLDNIAEADKMHDDDDDAAEKTERNDEARAGASMRKGAYDREEDEQDNDDEVGVNEDNASHVDEDDEEDEDELVTTQLLSTHLDDIDESSLMSAEEALRQWSVFQTATHPLSLALAAQLRLILTPSQATRLSGGFRTGKRLSIRKIIPYIASGYKRDKIWMRRSVPTKRAYQILLCVDDSKSMGEGGLPPPSSSSLSSSSLSSAASPGHLAMSSLVMVGRALAMLEAGQVGVLGFGARVFTAHALDADPSFGAAAAGSSGAAQTLRRFAFQQDRTDVALLLRSIIDRFQQARAMNGAAATGGGASADLWQLALILSDGLTPSAAHERIRRLLREAAEARIMVVFVILDGSGGGSGTGNGKDAGGAKRAHHHDSVLDLKEAKFVQDPATGASRVVVERYLDTFPFPYYLLVHRLEELPAALAGLLRTWFAEVNA
ncbi:denitrification regulatory protein nirq [Niveomyces insectorum RCEF 264]|uniref:Midasin n=1 Tax=Niveomyces insectorum RCEF 264 TaxID=1081102 RepID=A0A167N2U8_9HYPO|nr:denitrification regulatory protein nirq [Niveomyces insectorum RCEF 264]